MRETPTTKASEGTTARARLAAAIREIDDLVTADARELAVEGAAAMLERSLRWWRAEQRLGAGALVKTIREGGPMIRPEIERSPALERRDAWRGSYDQDAA